MNQQLSESFKNTRCKFFCQAGFSAVLIVEAIGLSFAAETPVAANAAVAVPSADAARAGIATIEQSRIPQEAPYNLLANKKLVASVGFEEALASALAAQSKIDVNQPATKGDLLFRDQEAVEAISALSVAVASALQPVNEAIGIGEDRSATPWRATAPIYSPVTVDVNGEVTQGAATVSTVRMAVDTLSASVRNVADVTVKYDDARDKSRVTLNSGGVPTVISNTAPGALSATSTEAVNGSQLFSSEQQLTRVELELNARSDSAKKAIVESRQYAKENFDQLGRSISQAELSALNVSKSLNKTNGDIVNLRSSIQGVTDTSVKYDDANDKSRITLNSGGAPTVISNTAPGALSATSTEAVNGSQLFSSEQQLNKVELELNARSDSSDKAIAENRRNTEQSIDKIGGSISKLELVTTFLTQAQSKTSDDIGDLQTGKTGVVRVNSPPDIAQPEAKGAESVAAGGGSKATGDNALALGASAQSKGNNTAAIGGSARASAENSTALGANSIANRANTISVGHQGGERQITNVSGGTRNTDAVNVSQLNRSVGDAVQSANAYTDKRYAELRRDIKRQDSTLSAGIAGAMAMASLPRSTVAGGGMTSVSMGNYRGESAVAIGVSYVSESGRWSSNLLGTTDTRSQTGVAAGVGYQW